MGVGVGAYLGVAIPLRRGRDGIRHGPLPPEAAQEVPARQESDSINGNFCAPLEGAAGRVSEPRGPVPRSSARHHLRARLALALKNE